MTPQEHNHADLVEGITPVYRKLLDNSSDFLYRSYYANTGEPSGEGLAAHHVPSSSELTDEDRTRREEVLNALFDAGTLFPHDK